MAVNSVMIPGLCIYKTFYRHNKFLSIVSQCPCYCQSLYTGFDKHTRLQNYRINYGRKQCNDPGACTYKFFYMHNKFHSPLNQCLCYFQLLYTDYDKHTRLQNYGINYSHEQHNDPGSSTYKTFYRHNKLILQPIEPVSLLLSVT